MKKLKKSLSNIIEYIKVFPDDDISKNLIKRNLKGVKIEYGTVPISETSFTTHFEYRFIIEKLPIILKEYYTGVSGKTRYVYLLIIDNVEIETNQKYLQRLASKLKFEVDRPIKEDKELIKKDIRITLLK